MGDDLETLMRKLCEGLAQIEGRVAPLSANWRTRHVLQKPDPLPRGSWRKSGTAPRIGLDITYVRPNCSFVTDREGAKLWAQTSNAFDTVNIMGYDAAQFCDDGAGGLTPELFDLNFERVLQNFHEIGNIPKSKLMMGFGVGDQDAGAKWEGMDKDVEVFKYLKQEQYGGGFIWAVNCNPDVTPNCPIEAPKAARLMNQELQPVWPWGKVPTYSKCNLSTGWGPLSSTETFV